MPGQEPRAATSSSQGPDSKMHVFYVNVDVQFGDDVAYHTRLLRTV